MGTTGLSEPRLPSSLPVQSSLPGRSLEAENSVLRDRVQELEELIGLKPPSIRYLPGCGKPGWRLLGLFVKRKPCTVITREYAFSAVYGGQNESRQPADMRIIDTNVSRLNKMLIPYNVKIRMERGTGYYLDEENHKRLKAMGDR